jgi:hypothetical protein
VNRLAEVQGSELNPQFSPPCESIMFEHLEQAGLVISEFRRQQRQPSFNDQKWYPGPISPGCHVIIKGTRMATDLVFITGT